MKKLIAGLEIVTFILGGNLSIESGKAINQNTIDCQNGNLWYIEERLDINSNYLVIIDNVGTLDMYDDVPLLVIKK